MPFTKDSVADIIAATSGLNWQERLAWAAGQEVHAAFSTSLGLEDQMLTHGIADGGHDIRIFTLDTGRLFEETYTLLQETCSHYDINIETYHPDAAALQEYIAAQGVNGFYSSVEARKSCCYIRKVAPLKKALEGVDLWISGLRREQSDNRSNLPVAEWDEGNGIVKFYPLLDVTQEEMESYITQHKVPYNPLHDQGFPSIGCAPCTRAIEVGEHPRAGRWWWEQDDAQECGLHVVDGKLVRVSPKESYAI